jgi:hypothetical protein
MGENEMTRKDYYQLLAESLGKSFAKTDKMLGNLPGDERKNALNASAYASENVMSEVCTALEANNPLFNRSRFEDAVKVAYDNEVS